MSTDQSNLNSLAKLLDGDLSGTGSGIFSSISTDTRTLYSAKETCFIALVGPNHNAHDYVSTAYESGVRSFLVSEPVSLPEDALVCTVQDTLSALQKWASYARSQWNGKVIAIAGSFGKTITKGWLRQLLKHQWSVFASPGSFNSQVGVALGMLEAPPNRDVYLIEVGFSKKGELPRLAQVVQPDVVLFTNNYHHHLEAFELEEETAAEMVAFAMDAEMVVHEDSNQKLSQGLYSNGFEGRIFTWGQTTADIAFSPTKAQNDSQLFRGRIKQQEEEFTLRHPDSFSLQNAQAAIALSVSLGIPLSALPDLVIQLPSVSMKTTMVSGINGEDIIINTQHNTLISFSLSLDEMLRRSGNQSQKLVIFSDIDSQDDPINTYEKAFDLMKYKGIEDFIGVGEELKSFAMGKGMSQPIFRSFEELFQSNALSGLQAESILIKTPDVQNVGKLLERIQNRHHGTVLEVNLDHIIHNLNYYRSKLKKGVKTMAMVKAAGYGTGVGSLAHTLAYHQVDYLGVAYADEGISLRRQGIQLPIIVLNSDPETAHLCVRYQLEPVIFSLEQAEALANHIQEKIPVHIELDTGMSRLGFNSEMLEDLLSRWDALKDKLSVRGVFSHLVAADDEAHDAFTKQQIHDFESGTQRIEEVVGHTFIKHLSNTGGLDRWSEAHYDLVRLGIGLYGISSHRESKKNLLPAATFKTSISQIKTLKPGQSVGYNRAYIAEAEKRIAIIAAGYADGLSRNLSLGKGTFLLNGKSVKTLGNICMDMTMIDVTEVPCEVGDDVILFGENPRIEDLAKQLNTIAYEVLSGISQRVKRIYVHE